MENCDDIKTESEGRIQLFLNTNSSYETSEEEHSCPNKRKKLCEQNMFWIDTTREATESLNSESGKSLLTNEQNSFIFSNNTYLCDVKTVSPGPSNRDTESTFRNPQVYARRPPKISLTTREAPKNLSSESGKSLLTYEQNSCIFSNNTYLCDVKTVSPGKSDTESTFRNPQVYARRPPKISLTTREAPENLISESGKSLLTYEQNSCTFSNDTYLCDVKTVSPGPSNSDTESTFQNPPVYARRPPKITFDKQLFDFSKAKGFSGGRKKHMKKLTPKYFKSAVLTPKVYRHFTLYPPQNGTIPRVEQLPGCKTVVVSGLPPILKYGTVKPMFKHCGKTQQIRTVKKGVFLIAYACLTGVDNAIRLNGYKVGGVHKDVTLTGTVKVEFAPIWLEKHGLTSEKITYPSYSKKNVAKLIKDLEQDCMIERCVNVFIFWLEEKQCTQSNYLHFFLGLKAMHDLVSRCTSEENKFGEFVRKNYCNQVLKAFTLACSEAVLDNFNQFKNQVVKWKEVIEEINCCKSFDAILALKKTKEKLEKSGQQESITINSLSKMLYSSKLKKSYRNLIEGLEQNYVSKTCLNKFVTSMKKGRCTMFTSKRFFIALKAMHGFISRFTSDPTKFGELVCRGYCGLILKAFSMACSKAVYKNFKKTVYKNLIKKWKEYIEEIDKCKSWEAFVNREKEQKLVKSEILLTENDQPKVNLKVAETMTYVENKDIQDHKTANLNNENNIDYNAASNFKSENNNMNYETSSLSNENDTENNKDAGYKQEEIDIPTNETVSHNNETSNYSNENCTESNKDAAYRLEEIDIPNNETVSLNNETSNHSNENGTENNKDAGYIQEENDIPNNETVSLNNETGKSHENDILNEDTCNHNNENIIQNNESNNSNKKNNDNRSDIGVNLVEKEARLIAALGGFLHLHSVGASIGDICKYLLKRDPTITCQGIEDLMRKFPALFMELLTDDNSLITKWTILGME